MQDMRITLDVVDVMETVAHMTDSPEPAQAEAEAWMEKHYNKLAETMEYAAKEYICAHWKDN